MVALLLPDEFIENTVFCIVGKKNKRYIQVLFRKAIRNMNTKEM